MPTETLLILNNPFVFYTKPPNGLRYLRVGGTRKNSKSRKSPKPEKCSKMAQNPTRQVHALLGCLPVYQDLCPKKYTRQKTHSNYCRPDFNGKSSRYFSLFTILFQYLGFSLFTKCYRFFQGLPAFLLIVKIKSLAMQFVGRIVPTDIPARYFFTFLCTRKRLTNTVISRFIIPKRLFSKRRFFDGWEFYFNLAIISLRRLQRFIGIAINAIAKKFCNYFTVTI